MECNTLSFFRLAEYQRYVGPERSKNKRVTGTDSKEYTTYLKALVQYAVGGEDVFMKRLLQRRKAKEEGLTMAVLDEALVVAMFGTVLLVIRLICEFTRHTRRGCFSSGARSQCY